MPGQVEQLAPDLLGSQAEERSRRVGANRLQCPEQAEQGVLEDILGVNPAADPLVTADHLPGQ